MRKTIEYTESSGNVFADLGLSDPEERLQAAFEAIINNEMGMSDEELEDLYRIEVHTPQQLNVRGLYIVNFFLKDAPADSPVVHIQLQDNFDGTLSCTNRPAEADKTKYGALWDNKYVPLAQKHVARERDLTQEAELAAA